MDIEDAFGEDAIAAAGTSVRGEAENQLRDVIQRIYRTNETEPTEIHENVAVLMFEAGRAYQADQQEIALPVSLAKKVLEILIREAG